MSHKYNPSVTDMANAYLVAYGDLGNAMLIGAMFGRMSDKQKETIFADAIEKVREDMRKAGQL